MIPTFYGGEFAPDMESVSSITGLSTDQVIKTHTSKDYKVYSIGFTPGFPYLGGLDETLYCPRLESPRTAVVEFPNYNTAIECYDSAEYQEAHDILKGHVVRHHQIVEGS